jgi:hypothetical protein
VLFVDPKSGCGKLATAIRTKSRHRSALANLALLFNSESDYMLANVIASDQYQNEGHQEQWILLEESHHASLLETFLDAGSSIVPLRFRVSSGGI